MTLLVFSLECYVVTVYRKIQELQESTLPFSCRTDHCKGCWVALQRSSGEVRTFPCASVVKNQPANAGAPGDMGSIPGSGRSPEEEMATHFSILLWEIPWAEEPGGLQSTVEKSQT